MNTVLEAILEDLEILKQKHAERVAQYKNNQEAARALATFITEVVRAIHEDIDIEMFGSLTDYTVSNYVLKICVIYRPAHRTVCSWTINGNGHTKPQEITLEEIVDTVNAGLKEYLTLMNLEELLS